MAKKGAPHGPLITLLKGELGPYAKAIFIFTLVVNITLLVSPLYMLQVYDRVLTSGSLETLALVSMIAVVMLGVYAIGEGARRRSSALAAVRLQNLYDSAVFAKGLSSQSSGQLREDQQNLTTLHNFLSHGMALPLFDLPFAPFFIAIMFVAHPLIGALGLGGAILMVTIAAIGEHVGRPRVEAAQSAETATSTYAGSLEQQKSAILAMGMVGSSYNAWRERKDAAGGRSLDTASENAAYTSVTRGLRQMLQIASLGLGAVLVLQQQATPGVIIASSILLGRALAPIDQSVGIWRQLIRTRTAWSELGVRLVTTERPEAVMPMPRPDPQLVAENLEIAVLGGTKPLVPKFSVSFEPGSLTALVGSVGSGKTTLLQSLAGSWPVLGGTARLGGRDIHRWATDDRGRYVGYTPQSAELLPGTVAQNIARFGEATPESVIEAAKNAGAHRTILNMPDGYETRVGPGGTHLSAGQKHIVSLARAFYGDPVLLLLDEPSANLDRHLHESLFQALMNARRRDAVILVATHDPRLIEKCDRVVLMSPHRVASATPRDYLDAPLAVAQNQETKRAE
ncbi:type I secretion system permease/ATPase [Altericroceibacterium endophyticum]|uniref:ATP-binding cassette domain-containing protein n=1 Tax=Altericroceibacterium endophyticum TaxID=1808508 RepID=A0A6I4TA60_9SPHN|nr:ATP-binding cassette domain-containing protein [Altericroceibacterium endophyticum]MXO66645.1 ATP-binding cassette domain-containing protein [Altericroceibacterium endophyticum]